MCRYGKEKHKAGLSKVLYMPVYCLPLWETVASNWYLGRYRAAVLSSAGHIRLWWSVSFCFLRTHLSLWRQLSLGFCSETYTHIKSSCTWSKCAEDLGRPHATMCSFSQQSYAVKKYLIAVIWVGLELPVKILGKVTLHEDDKTVAKVGIKGSWADFMVSTGHAGLGFPSGKEKWLQDTFASDNEYKLSYRGLFHSKISLLAQVFSACCLHVEQRKAVNAVICLWVFSTCSAFYFQKVHKNISCNLFIKPGI